MQFPISCAHCSPATQVASFKLQFQAAVDALSVSAQEVPLLTTPDRPEFDDERQQILLDAVNGPRRKFFRLLWHPVAVALSALESGCLPSVRDGLKIVCLRHCDEGVERQELRLRALADRDRNLAPERAAPGVLLREMSALPSFSTLHGINWRDTTRIWMATVVAESLAGADAACGCE